MKISMEQNIGNKNGSINLILLWEGSITNNNLEIDLSDYDMVIALVYHNQADYGYDKYAVAFNSDKYADKNMSLLNLYSTDTSKHRCSYQVNNNGLTYMFGSYNGDYVLKKLWGIKKVSF